MRYSPLLLLILIITLISPTSLTGTQENSKQDNSKQKKLEQDNPEEENTAKQQPGKSNDDSTLNLKPDTGHTVPDMPDSDSISFLKSLMALSFVLGLIFLAAFLFKRFTGMKATGFRTHRVPISMVGNFPLGEKRFLAVMEIQDKHYFIGITQTSINLLSQLDLDLEEISQDEPKDFENIFQKARILLGTSGRIPGKK